MSSVAVQDFAEAELLEPFLTWLKRRGVVRDDSLVVDEFPWFGRRVDLAVLNRSGIATAFELKLRDNRRAIEQSSYNALSFDRSYVVTASAPTESALRQARESGVGIIYMNWHSGKTAAVLTAPERSAPSNLRRKLRESLRKRGATKRV